MSGAISVRGISGRGARIAFWGGFGGAMEIILERDEGFIGLFEGAFEEEGLGEGIEEALIDDGLGDGAEVVLDISADDDLFFALEGIDANAGAAGEGGATDDADEFVGLIDDEAEVLKGRNGAAEDAVDVFGLVDTSLDGAELDGALGIAEDMASGLGDAAGEQEGDRCCEGGEEEGGFHGGGEGRKRGLCGRGFEGDPFEEEGLVEVSEEELIEIGLFDALDVGGAICAVDGASEGGAHLDGAIGEFGGDDCGKDVLDGVGGNLGDLLSIRGLENVEEKHAKCLGFGIVGLSEGRGREQAKVLVAGFEGVAHVLQEADGGTQDVLLVVGLIGASL